MITVVNPYILAPAVDEDTVLLLHCDGSDASTSFPDSALGGNAPHTVTAVGNTQVDTAIKKFGTGSALLDGTGDYLTIPDSSDWDLPNEPNWTIEMYVYWLSQSGVDGILHNHNSAPNGGWEIDYSGTAIRFLADKSTVLLSHTVTPTLSTWYHIAVSYDGSTYRLFWDGTQQDSVGAGTLTYETGGLSIGSRYGSGSDPFHGHMDEIRVSHAARYTTNFTPGGPFSPYL
jgi:hypothetical protein